MKQQRQTHPRAFTRLIITALALLLPATLGGCPEFRNQVVDAAETAALGIVFADQEPCEAWEAAGLEITGAVLELLFDQFRVDTSRY